MQNEMSDTIQEKPRGQLTGVDKTARKARPVE